MAMSTRGRSANNDSNTSQAAESSGSDTSPYVKQILTLMEGFNLPRGDAEAECLIA